ncbi:hypothetical protein CCR94_05580 [Rhodoblastus sphagnicola]|uniref:Uncharacterized protein n=1 Tax=Rhodoblastus sphagnicola TaxID=333368 RepID=A0A2S6NCV5_9HYPH|nr:hypothetical protein [Rhodoblastus sphagnicola]MBB4196296.1 hypothetical protein [Rhodoblastus sphagnicola]PPQ32438.1 hypothetical protein CCR94_05580 [Rhodoblastus sphagnicola]
MSHVPVRISNQQIEQAHFEEFRKAYALPPGEIKYSDKPDVFLKGDRTIGIEITNFYVRPNEAEGSEQTQRPLRDAIISKAHKLYRKAGGKEIILSIAFDPEIRITKDRCKVLPQILANFATQIDTQPEGQIDTDSYPEMPELNWIHTSGREFQNGNFELVQSYSVPIMPVARLNDIVTEKEGKAADYHKCDAYWLLIVVDFWNPAQDQEITTQPIKLASKVFEKIILFKTCHRQIVEI